MYSLPVGTGSMRGWPGGRGRTRRPSPPGHRGSNPKQLKKKYLLFFHFFTFFSHYIFTNRVVFA